MKPCQTSDVYLSTWKIALRACTSSFRSNPPWTATTMPPDTCVVAWCCQDQPPYLGSCFRILALCGHPRTPTGLIVWRMPFPKDIVDSLVIWTNPQGTVNNSEFELAGGIVHSECVAQYFGMTECTTLSCNSNMAGICWQRKGSAPCTSALAHLLQFQAM